ncbi:unnamed protein product [Ectocarpus fasciculatus]
MSNQPQYYRITDSLESLNVRIRLRKIFGRSINTSTGAVGKVRSGKKGDHSDDADNAPGSFLPGDEADIRVKWQEKVFGPEDVVTLSSGQRRSGKSQQQRAVGAPDNPLSRLERDYAGHLEDLRRDGVDPLESLSEVMLFTYTDKDGFVPPSDKAGAAEGGLTTGDGGPFSYLEEAVTSMPRTAASSLLETAKTAAGGGRGAGGGGAGGRNSRAGVSDTAAVMQAHLAREDKYKVMYIMAAVDVDVREATKAAKSRAAAPGGGSRWRQGEDAVDIHAHEQVVCSIKAHQNGTLEIAPGFSAEEPESGDEGAFLTDHTLKVMDKEGARLTTYRFTSPSGGVFSYTVENDSEPGGGVEEIEAWEAEEASRDLWKKASRQQNAGTQLVGAPVVAGAVALHVFMEIVSASGFAGVNRLYTEYALCLPQHWIMADEDGSGGAGGRGGQHGSGRGDRGDHTFSWENGGNGDGSGDFAAGGTTQVASQAYPLAVPHRSARSATTTTTSKSDTRSGLGHGPSLSSSTTLSSSSTANTYGNSAMPASFQAPPKIVMSGAALRASSAILLCFLGLLASLGESPFFWVVLGGAVVVVAAITGDGSGGGEGGSPVAHFGFPAEFHLVNEEEGEMAGIGERPQVLLAVSSLDGLARHRVEGYGYVSFPRQPGAHELHIRTWRPVCSIRTHLQARDETEFRGARQSTGSIRMGWPTADFFVGGAHRLHDPRYASKPGSFRGTFLNRFGFRTETSGTLRVRLHLAEQGRVRDLRAESGGEGGGPTIDLAGTRTVKEILRVVNAKRMGVEIGRRFSATVDPASTSASAAPNTPAAGSAAPAAAPAASSTTRASAQPRGSVGGGRGIGGVSGGGVSHGEDNAAIPLLGSRSPFDKTLEGRGTGKIEAAADLLARVRGQLERSEQRTKGSLVERGGAGDMAPPR